MGTRSPEARRRLIGGAIVLFWLVMFGVLLHRELGGRGMLSRRSVQARIPKAGESWFGVLTGGERIGVIHLVTQPGDRDGRAGVTTRLDLRFEVRIFDAPAELRIAGWIWRALAAPDAAFEVRVASGAHAVQAEGTVKRGQLEGVVRSAGETFPVRARVGRLLEADDTLLGLPSGSALAPGQETSFESLDPFTLRPAPARARCLREERLSVAGAEVTARVVEVAIGTASVTAWLDADRGVVKAEMPFGLTLRRLGREEALAPQRSSAAPDLLAALRVAPTGRLPERGARRMLVRIGGVPASQVPSDDTQTLLPDDRLLVVSPPADWRGASGAGRREGGAGLAAELACNALVQCSDPRITSLAAEIAGREENPWARALAINRWVDRSLAKRTTLSLPSAVDVLETREGDCTEHTVLFTALARAAGIPTRMAAGLVWSDELHAFAYHAWPEVYVGRWVWTDPTLGQPVADATHVKLATGGIEDWRAVVAFLGRVRLEVVEVR